MWTDEQINALATRLSYTKAYENKLVKEFTNVQTMYETRIRELEAEKKALKNYIETLEAFLSPEELFDAAN